MKFYVIFLIIFILLLSIGGFIYYKYHYLSIKTGNNFNNYSISAIDENGNLIKTNYEIYLDNIFYKNGETNRRGVILVQLASNKKVDIINKNLKSQNYYSNIISFNSTNNSIYRAQLFLIEPSEIKIKEINRTKDKINLKLSTDKIVKNLKVCLKYSSHVIFARVKGKNIVKKLDRFSNYVYCYDLNENLNKTNSILLSIDYETFGKLNDKDYINISIIDGIRKPIGMDYSENVGIDDKIYNININNIFKM